MCRVRVSVSIRVSVRVCVCLFRVSSTLGLGWSDG